MGNSDINIRDNEDLHKRIAAGEEEAFSKVFNLNRPRLLYYAHSILSDWNEAEDVVSDSFMALWKSRDRITSDDHLKYFLFTTVRNRALTLISSRGRKGKLIEHIEYGLSTEERAFDAGMVEEEMLHLLNQAVKSLPKDCRRIFELYWEDERNPKEIANLLNVTPATVRSQKRRAIKLIQAWIAAKSSLIMLIVNTPIIFF